MNKWENWLVFGGTMPRFGGKPIEAKVLTKAEVMPWRVKHCTKCAEVVKGDEDGLCGNCAHE